MNSNIVELFGKVQQWKKESRTNMPQLKVLGTYNNFSGVTDKHGWLVSKYSTCIRGKLVLAFVHSNN